jgi:hypothetical protein
MASGWSKQHTAEGKCPQEKPVQQGNQTPIKPLRAHTKVSDYFWSFDLHLINIVQEYLQKGAKAKDVPAVKHRLQRKTSTTNASGVGFVVERIANPLFHPIANSLCENRSVSTGCSMPRVGS